MTDLITPEYVAAYDNAWISWTSYRQCEPLIRSLINAFKPVGFYTADIAFDPRLLDCLGARQPVPSGYLQTHCANFGRYLNSPEGRRAYRIAVVRKTDRSDGRGSFFRFV